MPSQFSSIDAAVAAIARGECVIVVDAEDRETEGDFVCAGDAATPGIVNFMITHGRGQVCLSILPDVAKRLELPMMCEANSTPLGTAFTVPVDHKTARTGITAGERSTAIAAILDPDSRPADFVGRADNLPALDTASGQPHRHGIGVVVPAPGCAPPTDAIIRAAAEFTAPDNERFVQQAGSFQILQ